MSTSILINIMTYTIILSTGFSCAYLIFISDTLNNLFPIMNRYVIKHSSFEYLCLKTVKFIDISTHLGPTSLKTVNVTNSATFNTDFPWLLHTYTLPNYFAISALSHSPWDLGPNCVTMSWYLSYGYHSQTIRIGRPNLQLLIIFLFFQLKGTVCLAEKSLTESFHPENIVVVFRKLKMSSDNKFPTKNSLCTSLFGQITKLRKSRFVTNTTAIDKLHVLKY